MKRCDFSQQQPLGLCIPPAAQLGAAGMCHGPWSWRGSCFVGICAAGGEREQQGDKDSLLHTVQRRIRYLQIFYPS